MQDLCEKDYKERHLLIIDPLRTSHWLVVTEIKSENKVTNFVIASVIAVLCKTMHIRKYLIGLIHFLSVTS